MKTKKIVLSLFFAAVVMFLLASCGETPPEPPKQQITGVTFSDMTVPYDGQSHTLTVTGNLPQGVSVEYTANIATNVGTYSAKAVLSGTGYETLTLNATLKITKANITGVAFAEDNTVKSDGKKHLPKVTGTLPADAKVKYYFNEVEHADGVSAVGTYAVKIVYYGCANYNDLTLTGTFRIKADLVAFGKAVFASFGQEPEPWGYFPNSFAPENRLLAAPLTYETDTAVSAIPLNGMGKQLHMFYTTLNLCETALGYVHQVYHVLGSLETAYTTFLSGDPEEYKTFSKEIGGLTFAMAFGDDIYAISVKIGTVDVLLFASADGESYGARIQLTPSNVLKYTVTEDSLLISMSLLNHSASQIRMTRDKDGNVMGYICEHIYMDGDAGQKTLYSTSSLLTVLKDYTVLIGTKGDFIPTADSRNCEVYRNSDGQLVGTEVREYLTVSGYEALYNTLWYPLADLGGVEKIRKEDKVNGLNADTIYINGAEEAIHTKLWSTIPIPSKSNPKAASRRYDIEFKTMYFFTKNAESGEYETVTCEVPMLFIQEEMAETFLEDYMDKNGKYLKVDATLKTSEDTKAAVKYGYETLLPAYDKLGEMITIDSIIAECAK